MHTRADSGIGTHTHYAGISLGIIAGSLEKQIIGADLPKDVTPVHVTIPKAQAADAARLIATAMQRGGDMDGPMCSSNPVKTMIQAHYGEARVCKMMSQVHKCIQVYLIGYKHHGLPI